MSPEINADRIRLGVQHRTARLVRMENSEETRAVELSFSSEEPYQRWWGIEILGHDKGEVDLSWLETGHAALLMDHNMRDQIGVIEKAEIGAGRKGRAVVRFGKSARAEEIFRDVLDDIRGNVSVGYEIHELRLVEEKDDVATYRVTSWKPLEISIVSIPADTTVGVGRQAEHDAHDIPIFGIKEKPMPPENNTIPATPKPDPIDTVAIRAQAEKTAREATAEIYAIGKRFGMLDAAEKAANEAMPVDEFRKMVLTEQEKKLQRAGTPDTEIGMGENDQRNYSLLRAINAAAKNDWRKAGLEREASEAIADKLKREARGFFVPYDVLKRELTAGALANGGNLVGTTHMAGSFIDLLRNRMMVTQLGAQMMSGLVGNLDIPKLNGGATAYWLGEGDNTTGSDQAFGTVPLTPKTISAKTSFTRRLMMQSSPDVENVVRDDLNKVLALGIDLASIAGTGSSNQPTGIINTVGIGAVVGGANGAAPTWQNMIDLETEIAQDNADVGSLAYLTNTKVRGKLKSTEKAANTGQFVWGDSTEPGFGMVNGYRAGASNQVPGNLTKGSADSVCSGIIFGNWSDLLIGEWGVLDLQVDPYSSGDSGGTIVRAFQDIDIAVRHAESFAAMLDALTA
jgi:HK97 family phage major capsid protein